MNLPPAATDVLVIGGGPAGLAAAEAAAGAGASAVLLDSQPVPGGQIWRAWPQTDDDRTQFSVGLTRDF